ncbi:unnamed protein product [Ilex paraguariensis]|uniref:Phorbol-ester/DAG-type domain-containing protein n=1 Tax=Ilex paraguariensis TaxID=185542 RepID=A0ABC8SHV5_9AQUA
MITHKSHEHPLAFLLRPTSFFCNLCRMEHKDSSYVCVTCQFWIHKRCALLPTTISRTDHHHPLILEKLDKFTQFDTDCYICDERINRFYWAYYCFRCRCSIHVKCSSTSSSTPLRDLESEIMDQKDHDLDVLHLPMNCFVEHLLLEKIEDEPMISHWSHEHQLTLFKVQNDNETNNDNTILCDSCVQPISHPFYCCTQCVYFLHLNCANLPPQIQHPLHQHPIQLSNFSEFYRLTGCEACESYNNGFFYKCDTCKSFAIDVKCALLPASIVHEAHKHSLCQRNNTRDVYGYCSACGLYFYNHGFGCKDCNFRLCCNCALLPKTVEHRWDRHSLILTYPPIFDHPQDFYCEICEEEINTREWIYHCRECDQSFHLQCIHRTYRNVKFGGSREFKDHQHPLKFLQNAMKQFTCCRCGGLSGMIPYLNV